MAVFGSYCSQIVPTLLNPYGETNSLGTLALKEFTQHAWHYRSRRWL